MRLAVIVCNLLLLPSSRPVSEPTSSPQRCVRTLTCIGVVSEAIAIVRDGHMRLEYDEATTAALVTARLLPLRVASEGGKIVVAYNDAIGDDTIRPGMELLSVNGRPMVDITQAILSKLSGDGFIETGKAWPRTSRSLTVREKHCRCPFREATTLACFAFAPSMATALPHRSAPRSRHCETKARSR